MDGTAYRVSLDLFSGPLDLLLYLVKRQELDIVELPIARITGQFLEFLEVLQVLDLDLIGDFVVMASTLAEIKSRLVLPRPEEDEVEESIPEADPQSDLVRQLIEYKRFKDAAVELEEQAALWQERYPRLSDERPRAGNDPAQDRIKSVELWDLVSALGRILRHHSPDGSSTIVYDDTPISTYIERIKARLAAEGPVLFSALFDGVCSRSKLVGLFLAVLELLRHHGCRAEQGVEYGDILIHAAAAETSAVAPEVPSETRSAETRFAG